MTSELVVGGGVGEIGQRRAGFGDTVEAFQVGEAEAVVAISLLADQRAVAGRSSRPNPRSNAQQCAGYLHPGQPERGFPAGGEQWVAVAVGESVKRSPVSKTLVTISGSEAQFQMRWLDRSHDDTMNANNRGRSHFIPPAWLRQQMSAMGRSQARLERVESGR